MERVQKLMKESTVKDNYNCPKCRDLGYTFEMGEDNNEIAVPCQCLSKKRAKALGVDESVLIDDKREEVIIGENVEFLE